MKAIAGILTALILIAASAAPAQTADIGTNKKALVENVNIPGQEPYLISPEPSTDTGRATATAYVPASQAGVAPAGGSYKIQPYDSLHIRVWPYDELSIVAPVRPDGTVSYPFIGEIKVEGMTAGEVGTLIAKSIEPYMKDPKVAVNLVNVRSERAIILGKVMKPGQYDIRRGETVFDVIGKAGGFAEGAKRWEVGLIRQSGKEDAAPVSFAERAAPLPDQAPESSIQILDLDKAVAKGQFPDEYAVRDGDIIYVPERKKVDWMKIQRMISTLYYFFKLEPIEGLW